MTSRLVTGQDQADVFNQMADIHREAISEGFLSTLGQGFLVTLYQGLSDSPNSFVFATLDEGRMLGFIVGAMDTGSVYKEFMRRAGVKAFVKLLPKLVSVARVKRVFETLLYPKSKKGDQLPEPEILNFCVRKEAQGKGVGSVLFRELCDEFRRRGVPAIRIVTGESQKSAQSFYEKHGAQLASQIEVHKDTKSRVYVFAISDSG